MTRRESWILTGFLFLCAGWALVGAALASSYSQRLEILVVACLCALTALYFNSRGHGIARSHLDRLAIVFAALFALAGCSDSTAPKHEREHLPGCHTKKRLYLVFRDDANRIVQVDTVWICLDARG